MSEAIDAVKKKKKNIFSFFRGGGWTDHGPRSLLSLHLAPRLTHTTHPPPFPSPNHTIPPVKLFPVPKAANRTPGRVLHHKFLHLSLP